MGALNLSNLSIDQKGILSWTCDDSTAVESYTVEYIQGATTTKIFNAESGITSLENELNPRTVYDVKVIAIASATSGKTDGTSDSIQVSKLQSVGSIQIDDIVGKASWTNPNTAGVASYKYSISNFNSQGYTYYGNIDDSGILEFIFADIGFNIDTDHLLNHRVRMTAMADTGLIGGVYYINSPEADSDVFTTGKLDKTGNILFDSTTKELTFDYVDGANGPRRGGYTVTIIDPNNNSTELRNRDFYSKNESRDKARVQASSLSSLFNTPGDWTVEIIANPEFSGLRGKSDVSDYLYTVITPDPTVTADVYKVEASNGGIKIILDKVPTEPPIAGDFTATVAIDVYEAKPISLFNFAYDGEKTVTFTTLPIIGTPKNQSVIVTIIYKGNSTESLPFIIPGKP